MRKHKNKQNESDNVDLEESQQDISLESKKTGCTVCSEDYTPDYTIECSSCECWIHYLCTRLPGYALASLADSNRQYMCKNCVNIPKSFWKLEYNSKEKNNGNVRESCKDEKLEEIVKLKVSVCIKEKVIENLEKLVNKNEERLKKYEDDLINLRSQIESKDNKIKSLEGRSSEFPDEKTKVSNLLKENKIRIDDYYTKIMIKKITKLKNGHIM